MLQEDKHELQKEVDELRATLAAVRADNHKISETAQELIDELRTQRAAAHTS